MTFTRKGFTNRSGWNTPLVLFSIALVCLFFLSRSEEKHKVNLQTTTTQLCVTINSQQNKILVNCEEIVVSHLFLKYMLMMMSFRRTVRTSQPNLSACRPRHLQHPHLELKIYSITLVY